MAGAVATAFLFVACTSGIVLGEFPQKEEEEVIGRFDRYRRQAQVRWPGDVPSKQIDYFFKDGISQAAKDLFMKATKAWEKYTCVKFKEKTRAFFSHHSSSKLEALLEKASDERMLVTDEGTQCYFKRNRTGQGLKVMYIGCGYFGGAAHELGHSLYLDHTHNRHDRDQYLDVSLKNVVQYLDQYNKLTKTENVNYDIPYDYGSIMHYGSSGPHPAMTPKDRRYHKTMGSPLISFTDLAMVNKHHNCEDSCRGKPTKCANRGFPNPNNCGTCVCPSGYGGPLCKDKSPKGKKIEVQILEMSRAFSWNPQGCLVAGIEIKTNADQRLTGYRFCSEDDVNTELKSVSNLVPIITYSMHTQNWLKVKLQYRYVD
ncbi:astacin [Ancylostoma ceylanicum]|uniref:Metalloendopeptidase n=1 Tax=Ancylostoma ceylanicum TaxID=53326 RepID=A0A0D6MA20_9BILA|nr:astacin [Ancylostoma ceylanicum]